MTTLDGVRRRVRDSGRRPRFENLLAVCRRERPSRPTPFEFIVCDRVLERFAERMAPPGEAKRERLRFLVDGFVGAGFDCAVVGPWEAGDVGAFGFPRGEARTLASKSMNDAAVITDEASFDAYRWPDLAGADFSLLEELGRELPDGAQLGVCSWEGVLENAIGLLGFENLCLLLADAPDLVDRVFERVGSALLGYYERVVTMPGVGLVIANDDWGYKTQTMLSPKHLRRLVFPWYRRIVEVAHAAGKPVVLHSCGNVKAVIDDIVDDLRVDGKHSYEDAILPVEEAYAAWGDRVAIIGGIDVDFLCTRDEAAIRGRVRGLLDASAASGGLAIGSGNSIPDYVPDAAFAAMLDTVIAA